MDLPVPSEGHLCTSLMPKGRKCFIFIELTKVLIMGKEEKTSHMLDGNLRIQGKAGVFPHFPEANCKWMSYSPPPPFET